MEFEQQEFVMLELLHEFVLSSLPFDDFRARLPELSKIRNLYSRNSRSTQRLLELLFFCI
jgi:hypothetical protein